MKAMNLVGLQISQQGFKYACSNGTPKSPKDKIFTNTIRKLYTLPCSLSLMNVLARPTVVLAVVREAIGVNFLNEREDF